MNMKKMMKKSRGSILSIVLVIFMILVNFVSLYLNYLVLDIDNYKEISLIMKEKNLEILLTKYYLDTERDDILFSDSYEDDEFEIDYVVDINEYEEVLTTIHLIKEDVTYKWKLVFDDNMKVIQCNYV